jgi:hypothetical protein
MTVFKYNKSNNPVEKISYNWYNKQWDLAEKESYSYSGKLISMVLHESSGDKRKYVYKYNSNGKVIDYKPYLWDFDKNKWGNLNFQEVVNYDKNSLVTTSFTYVNTNNKLGLNDTSKTEYSYFSNKNIKSKITFKRDANTHDWISQDSNVYKYTGTGNPSQYLTKSPKISISYNITWSNLVTPIIKQSSFNGTKMNYSKNIKVTRTPTALKFSSKKTISVSKIEIFNLVGRKIISSSFNQGIQQKCFTLPVFTVQQGVGNYFYSISTKSGKITGKLPFRLNLKSQK